MYLEPSLGAGARDLNRRSPCQCRGYETVHGLECLALGRVCRRIVSDRLVDYCLKTSEHALFVVAEPHRFESLDDRTPYLLGWIRLDHFQE